MTSCLDGGIHLSGLTTVVVVVVVVDVDDGGQEERSRLERRGSSFSSLGRLSPEIGLLVFSMVIID